MSLQTIFFLAPQQADSVQSIPDFFLILVPLADTVGFEPTEPLGSPV